MTQTWYVPEDMRKCNIFRVYLEHWERQGWVRLKRSEGGLVWIGAPGDILFWPWPTVRHKVGTEVVDAMDLGFRAGIFANEVPVADPRSEGRTITPSFFWARKPGMLESSARSWREREERDIQSIFVGSANNRIQRRHRDGALAEAVTYFRLTEPGDTQPLEPKEYIDHLRRSKFALCLRGFGPKCNREIEALAAGAVPLVDERVDTEQYWNPLKEGKHYLRYSDRESLWRLQETCEGDAWRELSLSGWQWYWENASFTGAFNVMSEIVEWIG